MSDTGSKNDDVKRSRRGVLALLGVGSLSGCLRMDSQNTPTTTTPEQATAGTTTERTPETTTDTSTTDQKESQESVELAAEWGQMGEVLGRPLVTDGRLYAPTRENGLMAIAATDGTVEWRGLQEAADRFDGLFGPQPVKTPEGIVFANENLVEGNITGYVYLVDEENGDLRAKQEVGPVLRRPAVTDGHVIVGPDYNDPDTTSTLYGLTLPSLDVAWSTESAYEGSKFLGGVGVGDVGYVGFRKSSSIASMAVDASTGSVVWVREEYPFRPPQFFDGAIYLFKGDTKLLKVDPETGTAVWQRSWPEGDGSYVFLSPIVFTGRTGIFGFRETLRSIHLDDGSFNWTTEVAGLVETKPAIHAGLVWVVPTAHPDASEPKTMVRGYDIETGELKAAKSLPESPERVFSLGDRLAIQFDSKIIAYSVEEA